MYKINSDLQGRINYRTHLIRDLLYTRDWKIKCSCEEFGIPCTCRSSVIWKNAREILKSLPSPYAEEMVDKVATAIIRELYELQHCDTES